MRGARSGRGLGVLLAFGFFVSLCTVRCTYSPNFPSGTLKCSSVGSCPDGYACDTPSNLCYKNGESPAGTAGTGGGGSVGTGGMGGKGGAGGSGGLGGIGGAAGAVSTGGTGGTAPNGPPCAGTCTIKIDGTLANSMAVSPDSKFVGHWVYQTGSTETVSCSDLSDKTSDLSMDYVDITIVAGTLTGSYFCDWNLTVGPAGNQTIIKPGQSCSRNTVDAKTGTTHFTWHGTTFTFKTDDSKSGTLSSTIAVDYVDDPAKTGCSL